VTFKAMRRRFAKATLESDPNPAPMPIVVGVPRSGTTLLRLMLDAHPALAIPPETGFLVPLAALVGKRWRARRRTLNVMIATPPDAPVWPDFGIPAAELQRAIAAIEPFSVADAARCFYRLYAARQGKPRWGDKTPGYARHLTTIASLLPEARFIHLIRDGRDVAASLRRQWFAPGRDMKVLARHWRDEVREARRQGATVPHYLEVRYEALVRKPEAALRRTADFIDLPFDPAMLSHHERADARLAQHGARLNRAGREVVTLAQRRAQQAATRGPVDPNRIGNWRQTLTSAEIAAFEAEAGDLLEELGYERSRG
jgi:hypothetical protein